MPYKSGLFQAVLGALGAVAFVVSNSFNASRAHPPTVTGTVQKTGDDAFLLSEDVTGRQHSFVLDDTSVIYFNERRIPFSEVENGRRASIRHLPGKPPLLVRQMDLFPTVRDFSQLETLDT